MAVSNQNIVTVIFLTFSFKSSWHIIAIPRSSHPKVFCKKGVFKHFAKLEESNCAGVSFSTKLQANSCRKEIAAHVFSYKNCEIFKNIFLKEHLWMTVDMKFFKQFFTHIPETFGTFQKRFVFAIISLVLLLVKP